jgi:hypothetical protein
MRPSNGANIRIIAAGKPFKSLVNNDIVNQKIPNAISHDAKPDCLHPPYIIKCSEKDQQNTWDCEDDKECIVLFEKSGLHLVMIFMQVPKKTMHDIPMGKPCNAFHNYESGSENKYVK